MNDPIKAKIEDLVPDLNGDCVVTLAVVLRAIPVGLKRTTAMALVAPSPSGEDVTWNLEQDDYDQQSEECKQFIGGLLGVN